MRREENMFFNSIEYIICGVFLAFFSLSFLSSSVFANSLRLKYEYQHFVVNDVNIFFDEVVEEESTQDFEFCFSEDIEESILGVKKEDDLKNEDSKKNEKKINTQKIKEYVEQSVVPFVNQEKNDVVISRNTKSKSNEIVFDGYAQEGISVNVDTTVSLIEFALKNNIDFVNIDVEKTKPMITVNDEELKDLGITELVSVGRSNFDGSSWKRITNVTNGASKFNGYLIPKDYIFSFNKQLGEINASTGFVTELVILGDKVVPEYGGGLCQVSSTAYRGAMLSGMEIVERHNHSYAVEYYAPHGSDATVYSPIKDFKFKNTSGSALLLQTRRGGHNNNELFFHYYGTKPMQRDVKIFGPFVSNYRGALPAKITYDSALPEGSSKVVSHSVAGFQSAFYRNVEEKGKQLYKDIFASTYQARGYWLIKGGEDPEKIKKQPREEHEEQEVL